jgi:hypothetical protein
MTMLMVVWQSHTSELELLWRLFNSAAVLKERAKLAEQQEGLTYEQYPERRGAYAEKSAYFLSGITDTLSKKLFRKVRNRYIQEIRPWDRAGFDRRS